MNDVESPSNFGEEKLERMLSMDDFAGDVDDPALGASTTSLIPANKSLSISVADFFDFKIFSNGFSILGSVAREGDDGSFLFAF